MLVFPSDTPVTMPDRVSSSSALENVATFSSSVQNSSCSLSAFSGVSKTVSAEVSFKSSIGTVPSNLISVGSGAEQPAKIKSIPIARVRIPDKPFFIFNTLSYFFFAINPVTFIQAGETEVFVKLSNN